MKELVKGFLIYGLGSTLGKFISFFLLPIYTRVFTPEDYGSLDLILSIIAIIAVFGMLQIETGLQRFYYEKESDLEKKKLMSSAFFFTFICSVIVIIISSCLIPVISAFFFSGNYELELFIAFLSILPTNLIVILFVFLRFKKERVIFMFMSVYQILSALLLTLIFVLVFSFSFFGVIISNLISALTSLLILLFLLRKDVLFVFDKVMIKEMLSFGLPQFPARLGSISNAYINRFFMVGYLSVTAIGLYAVGLKVASGMLLIQSAFQLAWLPYLYEMLKTENHKEQLIKIFNVLLIAICYVSVICSLIGKEAILFLTTPEYIEAHKIIGMLTFYYGLFIIKEVVDVGIKVTKQTKYVSYIYIFTAILNIVLLFWFTPFLGINGVVLSLLISNIILYAGTQLVSVKLYPIKYSYTQIFLTLLPTLMFIVISMYVELSMFIRYTLLLIISVLFIVYMFKQYPSIFLNLKKQIKCKKF